MADTVPGAAAHRRQPGRPGAGQRRRDRRRGLAVLRVAARHRGGARADGSVPLPRRVGCGHGVRAVRAVQRARINRARPRCSSHARLADDDICCFLELP